jgi:chitodextrinase
MLNPAFAAIGIGRSYGTSSAYGWYWVTDFGGYVDSAPITPAPVISSFTVTPTSITSGQSATLTWTVSGATGLSVDNNVGIVTGLNSKIVKPTQTTTYKLTASNATGAVSAQVTLTVNATSSGDTQPPSAPALVSAVATSATTVTLSWNASTDNVGVAGYQVLRNGSPAGTTAATVRTYTDAVAANTTYTYSVRARDAAQNYSLPGNSLQVTTPALPTALTCPEPAENSFTGCYYNNLDLSGTPALVRNDSTIDFDWRYTDGPSPAISEVFSVRWQGRFTLAAGLYTFTVGASDGVRLYIDDNVVLDRWRDQPDMWYTVRPTIAAGDHTIRLEYYQRTGTPRVYLAWKGAAPAAAPVISSFTATPSTLLPGQSSTLAWTVSGATSISVDHGIGDVTGITTILVFPTTTTTYKLTAANSAEQKTAVVTVQVNTGSGPDVQAPSAPAISAAVAVSATVVNLTWMASTDNVGVAGYRVSRNGSQIATVSASSLSYRDESAVPDTTYTYTVRAFDAAGNQSALSNTAIARTPPAPVASSCSPGVNTFTGCYYAGLELDGTPTLIRTDSVINFDWTFTKPDPRLPAQYSVRWEGTFTFEEGMHTFYATASDGVRLYIDGILVLDRWRDQPVYTFAVRRHVTAGAHLMTMEYYQRTGTANAALTWRKE